MDFIDLKTQQTRIKETLNNNIQNVLAHGSYILGPEVKELEAKLAEGYQTAAQEGMAITKEFEAVDLEGWDEY